MIKSVALHTPFASSFFAIWIILYPSGMVTFTVRDSGFFATVVLLFCCVALLDAVLPGFPCVTDTFGVSSPPPPTGCAMDSASGGKMGSTGVELPAKVLFPSPDAAWPNAEELSSPASSFPQADIATQRITAIKTAVIRKNQLFISISPF